ncbi:MAG: DUF645 family protein [Oscillospiraceae bacterium]|nr:DUF645 family protein [Oscillospiraceae bacterium]
MIHINHLVYYERFAFLNLRSQLLVLPVCKFQISAF